MVVAFSVWGGAETPDLFHCWRIMVFDNGMKIRREESDGRCDREPFRDWVNLIRLEQH